jgi:hypothetical protein
MSKVTISAGTLNDISDELGRVCSAMFAITMATSSLNIEEQGAIMQVNGDSMNKIEALRAKIANIVQDADTKKGAPTPSRTVLSAMSIDDLRSAESAVLAARHIMLNEASSYTIMGPNDGLDVRRQWAQEQFDRLDAELLSIMLELDRREITDEEDKLTYVCAKASAFPHLAEPDYGVKLMRAAS